MRKEKKKLMGGLFISPLYLGKLEEEGDARMLIQCCRRKIVTLYTAQTTTVKGPLRSALEAARLEVLFVPLNPSQYSDKRKKKLI